MTYDSIHTHNIKSILLEFPYINNTQRGNPLKLNPFILSHKILMNTIRKIDLDLFEYVKNLQKSLLSSLLIDRFYRKIVSY